MVTLSALWLPILLSAVAAFFLSFVLHQVLPLHRKDYVGLPDEDGLRAALGSRTPPGDYVFPYAAGPAAMKDPEFQKKWAAGPSGALTVFSPGPFNMGKTLLAWFVYLVVIFVFVAYLAGRTLAPGADYLEVFRVVGTVAFLALAGADPVMSIWFRRKWSTTFKYVFVDGLLYALFAGGFFGWLWP